MCQYTSTAPVSHQIIKYWSTAARVAYTRLPKKVRVPALDVARAHALSNFENAGHDIEYLPDIGINQL